MAFFAILAPSTNVCTHLLTYFDNVDGSCTTASRRCAFRFSLTNTEVRQLVNVMPKMLQQNPFTMLERDVLPQPNPHQCPYPINVACSPHAPYRMYDGRCNNLLRPLWGSSHQPLARFLPPDYADGKALRNVALCVCPPH